jgi:hypothetical protein
LSSRFVSAPFCELGPAGTDQATSIFGGHLDDAILSDGADLRQRIEAALKERPELSWDAAAAQVVRLSRLRPQ